MTKNLAFTCVVALIGLSALLFTGRFASDFYQVWRLDRQVPLEALSFSTEELSDEKYLLTAHFRYLHYDGTQKFKTPVYKNSYAAEAASKSLFKKYRTVWIDSNHPEVASLTKEISYKEFAYTLILWGLTLYFILLNRINQTR